MRQLNLHTYHCRLTDRSTSSARWISNELPRGLHAVRDAVLDTRLPPYQIRARTSDLLGRYFDVLLTEVHLVLVS